MTRIPPISITTVAVLIFFSEAEAEVESIIYYYSLFCMDA